MHKGGIFSSTFKLGQATILCALVLGLSASLGMAAHELRRELVPGLDLWPEHTVPRTGRQRKPRRIRFHQLRGTVNSFRQECRLSIVAVKTPIQSQQSLSMRGADFIDHTAQPAMIQMAWGTAKPVAPSDRYLRFW